MGTADERLQGTGRGNCENRIDLRLSEEVRTENCSDFSHIFQSCGRIVHKFYGIIRIRKVSNKSEFMEVFRMKQKVPMICNIVSLILLIVFVIKSIVDYTQYSTSLNSAPFYLWVLVNALFLVIPAIILFVIGFVVKKKQ